MEHVFETAAADDLLREVRVAAQSRDAAVVALAFAVADAALGGAFDASGLRSARRWLAVYTESPPDEARRAAALGRHFALHPVTRSAVESGALSVGRAAVIAKAVTDARRARFRLAEEVVLDACARVHTVEDADLVMARWAADVDQDVAPSVPRDQSLYLFGRLDGGATVRGELDSETAAVVHAGLDACDSGPDPVAGPVPPRSLAQRRADAWGDMAAHVIGGVGRAADTCPADGPGADDVDPTSTGGNDDGPQDDADKTRRSTSAPGPPPTPAPRPPRVTNLVLDLKSLLGRDAEDLDGAIATIDGRPVLASAIERLLCDSRLAAILLGADGAVLDASTVTAEFTGTQRRLIAARDRGCVFPGCDAPTSWCDVHHLHHRAHGGGRSLDNGVLLCRRHHTLLHQTWPRGRRWQLHRAPDGTGWHATSPTEVTWTGRPDDVAGREPPDHQTAA